MPGSLSRMIFRRSGFDGFLSWSFKQRLAGQLDPTTVIDVDDLDLDHVADLGDVTDVLDEAVVQFGDVAHAVGSGDELDEGTEVLGRNDLAFEDGADLDLGAERFDFGQSHLPGGPAGRGNGDSAVVVHVDRRAGSLLDAPDGLATAGKRVFQEKWITILKIQ